MAHCAFAVIRRHNDVGCIMNVRALIGSLLAGAIGAAIWAAIAYYTDREIGWVAWGVGGLVGLGAFVGGRADANAGTGVLAAVVALASIATGKFIVVDIISNSVFKQVHESAEKTLNEMFKDDTGFKIHMAHQLVEVAVGDGKSLAWPKDMSDEDAEKPEDFPKEIWKDVETRWNGMSSDARKQYCEDTRVATREAFHSGVDMVSGQAKVDFFLHSFGAWDLLWGFLAVSTAFRVGSGSSGNS